MQDTTKHPKEKKVRLDEDTPPKKLTHHTAAFFTHPGLSSTSTSSSMEGSKTGSTSDVELPKPQTKNLLEEKGVQKLLEEIQKNAQEKAAPIIKAIQVYLQTKTDQPTRQKEAAIILRELEGLISNAFSEVATCTGTTYRTVLHAIKSEAGPQLASKMQINHKLTIYPKDAVLLKEICPDLFSHSATAQYK